MPELPEVETIVRGLAPLVSGRRIVAVETTSSRVVRGDLAVLTGLVIAGVRRHGKFIVFDFSREDRRLAVHLGMTGKLLLDGDPTPYTRAIFRLDDGVLLYDDIRQFGALELAATRLEALGPEPFEISAAEFSRRLAGRRGKVKPILLNQSFLRGLGNIYTDEALHRAGIDPRARASRLSRTRREALHHAIQQVLSEAIASGGSSISDYVDAAGRRGRFQQQHRVYGREGEPCLACGTPIRRIVLAQRGTHFCPRCQKR
jgi:formamidopyrimidine-DNA glycosylase